MRMREQLEKDAKAAAASTFNPSRCGAIMPCVVQADGTFVTGPAGWNCTKTATGKYEITHHLGTTAYTAMVGVYAQSDYVVNVAVESMDADKIVVRSTKATALVDGGFALLVVGL